MKKFYSYLADKQFLKILDLTPLKTQYVKITILNRKEQPIREIQGKVMNGSVSLNGDSSIRRTCNLTMIAEQAENDLTNINSLISINKKIYLETGFLNPTNQYSEYNIIWFPLGVYVIAAPTITHNISNITISLSLKDKMCLLNGEFGGVIPASINVNEIDEAQPDGTIITRKLTLIEIIHYILTTFGEEVIENIVINDIDEHIKKVMKWTGDVSLYVIREGESRYASTSFSENDTKEEYQPNSDIGYIYEDFYYPGELVLNAGSTVTQILDKIKNLLGNFEYFYDIEGKFVFQEIKNYLNKTASSVIINNINNDVYFSDLRHSKVVYEFDNAIANNFTSTPSYNLIKNDYVVWGQKTNTNNHKTAIRYHLAIDKKPNIGNTYYCLLTDKGQLQDVSIEEKEDYTLITTADWRTELYIQGWLSNHSNDYDNQQAEYYYPELAAEWHKIYDIAKGEFKEDIQDITSLDYFLDFIDSGTLLDQMGIEALGRRSKVISNEKINCVFAPDIPQYVFIKTGTDTTEEERNLAIAKGEKYIQVAPLLYNQMITGGYLNSCFDNIRSVLHEYTNYNSNVSFTALPVYYLEPNSRVTIRDIDSQIYGDYIIKTISLPLDISGTMNITCSKAIERV